MHCVLVHKLTSEVYACTLINVYDLPYYGAKFWNSADDAAEGLAAFFKEHCLNAEEWLLKDIEESELKLFNVKLKNNPNNRLFLNQEGKAYIEKKQASK